MTKWQYYMMSSPIMYLDNSFNKTLKNSVSKIWEKEYGEKKSQYEKIQELGESGWELISVTPIAGVVADVERSLSGYTKEVLFVFRKPIE